MDAMPSGCTVEARRDLRFALDKQQAECQVYGPRSFIPRGARRTQNRSCRASPLQLCHPAPARFVPYWWPLPGLPVSHRRGEARLCRTQMAAFCCDVYRALVGDHAGPADLGGLALLLAVLQTCRTYGALSVTILLTGFWMPALDAA